jgi:ABC-type nitrate/sulfonate/bicarbonate transport system ATPase subunit
MIDTSSFNGLVIRNLSIRYGNNLVVDSLNLRIGNEIVVLYGPSGCGKTSILKAILGISENHFKIEGDILLNGNPINNINGMVGMVFQGPVIPSWLTVYDLCRIGSNIRELDHKEQKRRIDDILSLFHIQHLSHRFPSQLSGGQKQRAAIAVSILNEPKVLLLDEPTTFLDGVSRQEIWNYIENNICTLNIPILVVSHDPTEALILGDRICVLSSPAKVIKQIDIPFPHPRHEELTRHESFIEIKKELLYSDNNFLR